MIPFFVPDLHDNHPNLHEAARSYSVGPGKYSEMLRPIIRQASGGLHPVLTVSGTVALELCLRALGLEGKRVMLPAYGVVATMNAVANVGVPIFVDIDAASGLLTHHELERAWKAEGCKADAVVWVHQGGRQGGLEHWRNECLAWARERGLLFIDDAACAYGVKLADTDAAIYSFSAPKILSCGQGGVALFREQRHANIAAALVDHGAFWRTTGMSHGPGSNLRLSDLQAAFLLDELPRLIHRQKWQSECVKVFLDGRRGVMPAFHNVFMAEHPSHRAHVIANLSSNIVARVQYAPFWAHPKWLAILNRRYDGAKAWHDRALHLPFGAGMTPETAKEIVAAL